MSFLIRIFLISSILEEDMAASRVRERFWQELLFGCKIEDDREIGKRIKKGETLDLKITLKRVF